MPNIKFSRGTLVRTNQQIYFSFGVREKNLKGIILDDKTIVQCFRVYLISEKISIILFQNYLDELKNDQTSQI